MEGGVGLAVSLVTLASLFSTCIECFDYFRAAQAFEEESEILLVKLDLEMTRLLIWGNYHGILRVTSSERESQLSEVGSSTLIQNCLHKIKLLLTNTHNLQNRYGLRTTTEEKGSESKYKRVISSSSMNTYKASYRRFWVQSNGSQGRPTLLSRTKWAIRDMIKFKELIGDLRDIVDGLNKILPVKTDVQNQTMKDDIASINELSNLRLVEVACAENYPDWSAKASAMIEASERGTVDRRNVEEWLRDRNELDRKLIRSSPRKSTPALKALVLIMTAIDTLTVR